MVHPARAPNDIRHQSGVDRLLSLLGRGLAGASGSLPASRPYPAEGVTEGLITASEAAAETSRLTDPAAQRRHAAGLMRINHVGEVCAQALYEGHALTVDDSSTAAFFLAAADEERDHLAWTAQRLEELEARPSLLLPAWYLGSLFMGSLAGLAGRRRALGFMAETERQVEAHLQDHLGRLPAHDHRSRAILAQMKAEEARHADQARERGAASMPLPVRWTMRLMSKVMTTVAYRL